MLAGYLAFGTGIAGAVAGLASTLIGMGTTLVTTVIPALVKAAVAMGPWGWAAL